MNELWQQLQSYETQIQEMSDKYRQVRIERRRTRQAQRMIKVKIQKTFDKWIPLLNNEFAFIIPSFVARPRSHIEEAIVFSGEGIQLVFGPYDGNGRRHMISDDETARPTTYEEFKQMITKPGREFIAIHKQKQPTKFSGFSS